MPIFTEIEALLNFATKLDLTGGTRISVLGNLVLDGFSWVLKNSG